MYYNYSCVSFEIAKIAEELGFGWGCLYHYDKNGVLHQNYPMVKDGESAKLDDYFWYIKSKGNEDRLMCDGGEIQNDGFILAPTHRLLHEWLSYCKRIHINLNRNSPFWVSSFSYGDHSFTTTGFKDYEGALGNALYNAFVMLKELKEEPVGLSPADFVLWEESIKKLENA